jgi:hypothetical protein
LPDGILILPAIFVSHTCEKGSSEDTQHFLHYPSTIAHQLPILRQAALAAHISSIHLNFLCSQLEMLRQENEHLCSKLDTVTAYLRAQHPTVPAVADLLVSSNGHRMQAPAASLSINKQPGKVGKVAKGREVLLVFEGDLNTCDRSVNLTYLRHSLHSLASGGHMMLNPRTMTVWSSLLTFFAMHLQERAQHQAIALQETAASTTPIQIVALGRRYEHTHACSCGGSQDLASRALGAHPSAGQPFFPYHTFSFLFFWAVFHLI